jgi:hypothetical protein
MWSRADYFFNHKERRELKDGILFYPQINADLRRLFRTDGFGILIWGNLGLTNGYSLF